MQAHVRSLHTSLLAVLLLTGTAALAQHGYVKIDVPRGYSGALARDQAAFIAYPTGSKADFGVTVFDGLSLRSLVDDNTFRTGIAVSNDLVAWAGPPNLFVNDGRHTDNLTSRDDNYYGGGIAVDGDRAAWGRLNPKTYDYDIVLRDSGHERTITHGLFAGSPLLSGNNGVFNAGDLYFFSAPPGGAAKVTRIPSDPDTNNGAFAISGDKVVWISDYFADPTFVNPVIINVYDGHNNTKRTVYRSSEAAGGTYGVPLEIDGFAYPNALFVGGTAPGENHEFLINVETGKAINIEDAITSALNASLAFPASISGDYVSFIAQTASYEMIVATYQISTKQVHEITRYPQGTSVYGQVWPVNASVATSTASQDSTGAFVSTGHIYYRLDDYIALVLRALAGRNEAINSTNRITRHLENITAAAGSARRGHVGDFLSEVRADRSLSGKTRAELIEAGLRMQDALR